MVPPLNKDWLIGQWRIPETYIPIVVGISLGILVLLCTLTVIVIWRCCQYPSKHREKSYGNHMQIRCSLRTLIIPPLILFFFFQIKRCIRVAKIRRRRSCHLL